MRFRLLLLITIIILYFIAQISSAYYSRYQNFMQINPEVQLNCVSSIPSISNYRERQLKYIKSLLNSENTVENTCFFPNPQIEPEDDKIIFNYKTFDKCFTPTTLDIRIDNNTIHAKCDNLATPLFAIDLMKTQVLGGRYRTEPKWTQDKELNTNSEYVIVRCGVKSIFTYFINRFKPKASKKANRVRYMMNSDNSSFTVMTLVFDSVSKYSAYRNLPKTVEFIENLGINKEFNETLNSYEFEIPTTFKPKTANSMSGIMYGKLLDDLLQTVGRKIPGANKFSKIHFQVQRKHSIWSYYSKLGYTTLFLMDTIWDYVVQVYGRYINADHVFANFWRMSWAVYRFQDFTNGQKCLGDRNSHSVSLNYSLQYFENYKNNNKFAHVHLDAAHEEHGNIKTVDDDLLYFLKSFFNIMRKNNENFVLMLLGDHGLKKIHKAQWDVRSYFEANIPMTYMFVSKGVNKKWKTHENLKFNTKQLIGRFDINYSLKELAYFPYDIPMKHILEEERYDYNALSVSSLFTEKVPKGRSCQDISVSRVYCPCSKFQEIDNYDEVFGNQIIDNILLLTQEYFKRMKSLDERCLNLEFYQVTTSKAFLLKGESEGLDRMYYVELISDEMLKVNVLANFCQSSKIELSQQILNKTTNPFIHIILDGAPYFIQINNIEIQNTNCKLGCLC